MGTSGYLDRREENLHCGLNIVKYEILIEGY